MNPANGSSCRIGFPGKCFGRTKMRRREFLGLFSGDCTAIFRASSAGRGTIRIGVLPCGSPSREYDQSLVEAFRNGLRQVGLFGNRDIVLDVVWTDDDHEKSVAQLIQRGAALLVPCGSTGSVAAGLNRYEGTEKAAAAAGVKLQSKAITDPPSVETPSKH